MIYVTLETGVTLIIEATEIDNSLIDSGFISLIDGEKTVAMFRVSQIVNILINHLPKFL